MATIEIADQDKRLLSLKHWERNIEAECKGIYDNLTEKIGNSSEFMKTVKEGYELNEALKQYLILAPDKDKAYDSLYNNMKNFIKDVFENPIKKEEGKRYDEAKKHFTMNESKEDYIASVLNKNRGSLITEQISVCTVLKNNKDDIEYLYELEEGLRETRERFT